MGNVLKMEKLQQIQALVGLGWSNRAISAQTGVDRDTVAKYRALHQNPPKVPTDPEATVTCSESAEETGSTADQNPPEVPPELPDDVPALPGTNSTQLRPFVEEIRRSTLRRLTAQRIYQDLVENHSYKGSYDSVKRYVRKLRKQSRRFRERLPHLPGQEAQVDFGKSSALVKVNGRYKRVWFFKMTLSCSKHSYEELVERQDLETFLRCHERAFMFFGGVPEIVTLDNVKAAVVLASLYDPVLNQIYFSFAVHWGFAANPCMPYSPEHKGVVEKDVGYTKHNALDGRRFESLEEGNSILRHWNKRWASTRIHGTTKCQVYKMFCELERQALRPLAPKPFEYFTAVTRRVDVNGMIEVDARYYAVPPKHVGDQVVVHHNQQWVKVFATGALIITHPRVAQKGKTSSPVSCKPEWKHPDLESQERYYLREARKIGPSMHAVVYKTLSDTHPLAIRRVRGLLHLAKKYGNRIAEEAANEAFRSPLLQSYQKMAALCERITSGCSIETTITQEHELIRSLSDYETLVYERTL